MPVAESGAERLNWQYVGGATVGFAGLGCTLTTVVILQPLGKVYDMVADPAVTPVTTPDPAPTDATAELLLVHVPPASASLNVIVKYWQTSVVPVTGAVGLTTSAAVTEHNPPPVLYVIVVVPPATAFTTPVDGLIVATAGLELDHVPPGVASVNVVVPAWQTVKVPAIGPGVGTIFTVVVVEHPPPIVYVIIAVPPDTPVITPELEPIVATAVLLLAHVPPAERLDKVLVVPEHMVVVPVIGFTKPANVTVIGTVTVDPVQAVEVAVAVYVVVTVGLTVIVAPVPTEPVGPVQE